MGRILPTLPLRALFVTATPEADSTLLGGLPFASAAWTAGVEAALRASAVQSFDVLWVDPSVVDSQQRQRLLAFSPAAKVVMLGTGSSGDDVDCSPEVVTMLRRPLDKVEAELALKAVRTARQIDRDASLNLSERDWASGFDLNSGSAALNRALGLARQVAPTRTPVLIVGEQGTCKARLARLIHQWSDRATEAFHVLRCGSTSAEALEEAWFGLSAEAGGAHPPDIAGRLDACHGATLLLDNVVELPWSVATKLERLLTDGQYERRDDFTVRSVDVRVMATSSVDPQRAVDEGRLRAELLSALDVVRIELPPLRERPTDIGPLPDEYLAHFSRQRCGPALSFAAELRPAFQQYRWPGNQRELCNMVERAVLLCDGDRVDARHFPPNFASASSPRYAPGDLVPLETIEDLHVRGVVAATPTIKHAAQVLGINYSTLWRRLRRQPGTAPLRLAPVKSSGETA